MIAILLAAALPACATTRYMGPLPAPVTDEPAQDERESVSPLVAPITSVYVPSRDALEVTPRGATLKMPDGERLVVPRGARLDLVVTNHSAGALEGLAGGAVVGALMGAIIVAKNDCSPSSDGCVTNAPAALLVTMLLSGIVGTLYGAAVGDRTTYRYGSLP